MTARVHSACPGATTIGVHRPLMSGPVEAVDSILVKVVALGGCHQSLGATDGEFEDGESAVRVVAGEQEADRQHTEVDGLVGGVDAENDV
jgi:hypothetical protein